MRGSNLEGGGGSGPPSLEFAMLNIADISGNDEKISYFSYLCTSTVIRQTESEDLFIFSSVIAIFVFAWSHTKIEDIQRQKHWIFCLLHFLWVFEHVPFKS